jgi:hypothetical protein
MLSVKFRGKRDKLESQASKIESGQTMLDTFSLSCIMLHLSKGNWNTVVLCLQLLKGPNDLPLSETNAVNQLSGDWATYVGTWSTWSMPPKDNLLHIRKGWKHNVFGRHMSHGPFIWREWLFVRSFLLILRYWSLLYALCLHWRLPPLPNASRQIHCRAIDGGPLVLR